MSKRKILILATALCMVAILAVGGTLAYFTDADADKNVMTIGKVTIEQIEDFQQGEILVPGEYITKEVNVRNTGNVAAYIRTIFAFENTPGTNKDGSNGIAALMEYDHNLATGEIEWFVGTQLDCLKVGEKSYSVGVLTYANPVPAGELAGVTLKGVRLNATVTQKDFVAAGGNVGSSYEILVLSQAVQTDPFTDPETALNTAFGEVSPANAENVAKWLSEVAISTTLTGSFEQ